MKSLLRFVSSTVSIALVWGMAGAAVADDYPNKPIRLIVGYSPGGINDIVARVIGDKLSRNLGQPVLVENRPGAGGALGANAVAKAKPDGFTLLLASVSNIAMLPSAVKALPYDPTKDFAPIVLIAGAPSILVVNPESPAHSVKDLIAIAKQNPGSITFASGGTGTSTHLDVELLCQTAGIKMQEIPYKGDAPGVTGLISGHVALMMPTLPAALPAIKAGQLRPIAISTRNRSSLYPGIPTVAESGLPDYEFSVWVGILAPAGTSKSVVNRLNAEIVSLLKDPSIQERLAFVGAEPIGGTPEQFAEHIKSEVAKWARVTKEAGINPQ